jgi:hypothetical protein
MLGPMVMVDPYATPAHQVHVRDGHCPVISSHKSWCGDMSGHRGQHWSPWLPGPGQEPKKVYWTDEWPTP